MKCGKDFYLFKENTTIFFWGGRLLLFLTNFQSFNICLQYVLNLYFLLVRGLGICLCYVVVQAAILAST